MGSHLCSIFMFRIYSCHYGFSHYVFVMGLFSVYNWYICGGDSAVDLVEVVHSEGLVEVLAAAAVVAVDLEEVVDGEGTVMTRYLQKILMLILKNITMNHQKQCRQVEDILCSSFEV